MALTYESAIPARRTIFKRHNRWPGFTRRLLLLTILVIAAA